MNRLLLSLWFMKFGKIRFVETIPWVLTEKENRKKLGFNSNEVEYVLKKEHLTHVVST